MDVTLKPVEEQVVVITGASSGIGLTTARMAAERGARLVLAARSEDALQQLTDEINSGGGEAVSVVADVRNEEDVREIANVAIEAFGGFDTWVNVAGAFLYGRLDETPVEEMREQFETNVWGLLYGSLEAADHLKDRGGAIINVGSVVSDRAIPLQGSYSASKQAVKGFTDVLRMELEDDGAPVSVTLVKPAAVDTPYARHAKNYMDREATLPPPLYAPETVAKAILHAAEHPERDVYVGGGAKNISLLAHLAPQLTDTIMERLFVGQQKKDAPARPLQENALDSASESLQERGGYDGHVSESSLYTAAVERRSLPTTVAIALGTTLPLLYALYKFARRRGVGGE